MSIHNASVDNLLDFRPLSINELYFAEVWAASSTMVGITGLAVAGNLIAFLLTTFCRTRSHFHSICIANLALADLAVGFFVPLHWVLFLRGVDAFNLPCSALHILQTIMASLQTISVCSVTLITLDRVCITLWPVRYHNRSRQLVPMLAVTSIWLFGPIPHIIVHLVGQSEGCAAGLGQFIQHVPMQYMVLIEFFLPLFLLVTSNSAIYHKVSNRQKPFARGQPSSFSKSSACCHEHPQCHPCTVHNPGHPSLSHAVPLSPAPPGVNNCAFNHYESAGSFHRLLARRRSTPTSQQGFASSSSRRPSIQAAIQTLRDLRQSIGSISMFNGNSRDQEALVHQILRKQHRRTLKLLVLLVMLFLLCRGPRAIFLVVLPWITDAKTIRMDRVVLWLNLLVQLNAALDPLAYSFWGNRLYKRRIGKHLDKVVRRFRHWNFS